MTDQELGAAFRKLVARQSKWSQSAFGTDSQRGPIGPLEHLKLEADEAIKEAKAGRQVATSVEIQDCFALVMDAARRNGMGVEELLSRWEAKLGVCEARVYPPPDPENWDAPVEHVKRPEDEQLDASLMQEYENVSDESLSSPRPQGRI